MSFHRTLTQVACAVALLAGACAVQAQTARTTATSDTKTAAERRTYIVQLAAAPLATYDGSLRGLAATKPTAGSRLNLGSRAALSYRSYLDSQRNAVLSRIGARPLHTYSVTFNGFAAPLTAAEAATLMQSPDVLSVVPSEVRQLDTTRTTEFLGLTAPGGVYSLLDGQSRNVKGEDVIIGVVDSGIWPESPAFSDKIGADGRPVPFYEAGTQVYGPPPSKWQGACVAGEGFTAAMCNNKLIGARYYVADFNASGAVRQNLEYLSPRDGATSGHGTHTASTSGGNDRVAIRATNGVTTALMSGVAPRARIAAYKVCWTGPTGASDPATGCYTGDMLAAIDDAVADGVDVINYSISGTQLNFNDPIETAYLNATVAGVFVSASAGNSGPGNQVAHISPWLITVGASTHDRSQGGSITLGNGSTYTGGSTNFIAAPTAGMVLSNTIPAAGQTVASANNCLANSLDDAASAGRIVVCAIGTNTQAARLAISAEVARAGGVGAVLTGTATALDPHTLPALQVSTANATAIRDYVTVQGAAATGTVTLSINLPGVNAPVMASFSSRGPNKANANILKPDVTGPGSAVIASNRPTLSATQRDQVVAGTLTPPWGSGSLSGTSMSSPHVAGSAALLRQMFPTWSPAAIKSALTTANTVVRISGGATDTNRWGYGAGHLHPNGAIVPSLVYDADGSDYGRFLCGVGLAVPAGLGSCATLGVDKAWNLNLSSLTAANVVVSRTLTRSVTNVGASSAQFVSSASLPGWDVQVTPASLTLAPGAKGTFSAKLTRTTATLGAWTFGTLSWSDGTRTVTSPLSALAQAFATPVELSDKRASGKGSKVFSVESSYTGPVTLQAVGLVPADARSATISTGQTQCYSFVVPAGTQFARFQLFNADTQGGALTDLDMDVFRSANCTGTNVGTSAAGGSDEVVTLDNPIVATYSVRVTGYATAVGGAAYTLSVWAVAPDGGTPTLRVTGPSSVYEGGSASVALSWAVPAGARYMGNVRVLDPSATLIGSTKVLVDNR
ncbi:MAG: S8 family serine peptidase [Rubrivivax sp.]|nr:S8 family serine peptidase [Rubrivivax sp.]